MLTINRDGDMFLDGNPILEGYFLGDQYEAMQDLNEMITGGDVVLLLPPIFDGVRWMGKVVAPYYGCAGYFPLNEVEDYLIDPEPPLDYDDIDDTWDDFRYSDEED
jgi:hypothetical protein